MHNEKSFLNGFLFEWVQNIFWHRVWWQKKSPFSRKVLFCTFLVMQRKRRTKGWDAKKRVNLDPVYVLQKLNYQLVNLSRVDNPFFFAGVRVISRKMFFFAGRIFFVALIPCQCSRTLFFGESSKKKDLIASIPVNVLYLYNNFHISKCYSFITFEKKKRSRIGVNTMQVIYYPTIPFFI